MKNFETKYGYFDKEGKEYVIKTPKTPKPWVNIISNGSYGLAVSQTGGGFSWDNHSEFNRITRWHQDLIQDNWGKYIYVRNNKTGDFWSPTWLPVKKDLDSYECRYGTGYAIFNSVYKDVEITIKVFVPFNDNLEIWDITAKSLGNEELDLSFFTYLEWVLGSSADFHREFHKQFLETEYSEEINGLTATKRLWDIPLGDRGHWNIEYEYTGFLSASEKIESYEGDKKAFIGQYGDLQNPKAVVGEKLNKNTGCFNDSIGSLKVDINVEPGKQKRFQFILGIKKTVGEIKESLTLYNTPEKVDAAFNDVKRNWDELLGDLEIKTPDDAMNYSVNTWYRYQAISGRLWGRTGYYQQSGAFGFRDQLQDSLVYLPVKPELTKEQIELHARHQMDDGTVLHWWHPITETGLETKMTDDLLWLPYLVSHYLIETADYSLLNHKEPFYNSAEKNTIYTHCKLAIEKVLSRFSERGLPLIGAGDWNDGMSAVGLEMKGESFWLAEFLYDNMQRFIPLAEKQSDLEFVELLKNESGKLKVAFNNYGWDGKWFLRATKDSGEKIGSQECENGKIYLNPQTWSVITGIADRDKQLEAMQSVTRELLRDNGCLLLQPAYSKPDKFIGYLSRYAAGRRENGGVYSHASTWAVWAYSILKDSDNAYKVFQNLCSIRSGMDPDRYVSEPYVMPGNIDGPDSPNYGMGGWSWYTGSASWFQKVIVDFILGIRADKNGLLIDPVIPSEWKSYSVKRKFRSTLFNITVSNPSSVNSGIKSITLNGVPVEGNILSTDVKSADVNVLMG